MAPAQKRRRTETNQREEITFDPSARQDYLTGFHKRKQQRIQNARETAAKRDKEDRVQERKQVWCTCGMRVERSIWLIKSVAERTAERRPAETCD